MSIENIVMILSISVVRLPSATAFTASFNVDVPMGRWSFGLRAILMMVDGETGDDFSF